MKQALIVNIKRRLTPQPVKIRSGVIICDPRSSSDIEVTCFSSEGIDAVKESLKAGLALSTEDLTIKVAAGVCESYLFQINLIAPPLYVVTTVTLDKELGVKLLEQVCRAVNV